MLGSAFFFCISLAMLNPTLSNSVRKLALFLALLPLLAMMPRALWCQAAPQKPLVGLKAGGEATLEADQQRQVGKIFYADGHVDLRYENTRLRADHVEYDDETQVATAHGNVQLDYMTQHVEADDGRYELRTGRGTFHHARATIAIQRRPMPTL